MYGIFGTIGVPVADHGVDVEVLAADLSDPRQLAHVETRLAGSPRLDLVVNNAGIGTFGAFHRHAVDDELREVDLNVGALVRLTHATAAVMTGHGSGPHLDGVSGFASLTPEFVARATLIAARKGKAVSIPGFGYRIAAALVGVTLRAVLRRFNGVSARRRVGHFAADLRQFNSGHERSARFELRPGLCSGIDKSPPPAVTSGA